MQKFIKYFLKNKAVTWLLLVLILAGGLFSYAKMGKLEDAPFTIKQALVLTPYPGASPSLLVEDTEDLALLCQLARATCSALPPPRPKRTQKPNKKRS